MYRLDLTKQELEDIKTKVFLTEMQERLLEYRLNEYTLVKMAILEHCSESTVSRELHKALKKIAKVL